MPVEYEYEGDLIIGRYENGIKLVMRLSGFNREGDWNVPGSCPVRFEGDEGWVEAGDHGTVATSSDLLLEGQPVNSIYGTDPINHVRDFLDGLNVARIFGTIRPARANKGCINVLSC